MLTKRKSVGTAKLAATAAFFVILMWSWISPAQAWTTTPTLNQFASLVAMRPVEVRCYESVEPDSPETYGAWGYVNKPLGKVTWTAVAASLCRAAEAINDPNTLLPDRSLGVLVILHESYHLRRWGAAGNEAKVECKAIRHWRFGARYLGASEEAIALMWPHALAQHHRLTYLLNDEGEREYYDPSCVVPK